jgi:hypothetical protein
MGHVPVLVLPDQCRRSPVVVDLGCGVMDRYPFDAVISELALRT